MKFKEDLRSGVEVPPGKESLSIVNEQKNERKGLIEERSVDTLNGDKIPPSSPTRLSFLYRKCNGTLERLRSQISYLKNKSGNL